ncbi:spherulation-specific family 4 protein [Streptantibioticus ferralitis]|uniref:Spherulation-specific family 4 protein n=1 Tax=Streptantibioticus ferralitis TaxID=236510 RepID=A0ABT5YWR9_9ACTN|nr:spherulation-specific family 4 protein [Streptantibioticus ferralitis]MDF2255842.1 spherulation-specific family 4 protein [Streptantibioticus ferralitis]
MSHLLSRWRRLGAAVIASALTACAAPAADTTSILGQRTPTPRLGQRIAVPAYMPASDTTSWNELSNAGSQLGLLDGGLGSSAISTIRHHGTKVVGYVDTGWFGFRGKPTADGRTDATSWLVQAEQGVDALYSRYGSSLDGIFFDDATTTCGPRPGSYEYVDYYRRLNDFVHTTHRGSLTVANPNAPVPQCYENAADVLVTFEGTEREYLNPSAANAPVPWQLHGDPDKFWNIVHDVRQSDLPKVITKSKQNNAGYLYATDRAGTSAPYQAMPTPSYFNTELADSKVPDSQTPVTPGGLTASYATATTATLRWASAPTTGAVGYDVYANNVKIGSLRNSSPSAEQFTATGLTPATRYTFTVRSRDMAGTQSSASPGTTVTTRSPDGVAPTAPRGLADSDLKATSTTLSWAASTPTPSAALASYDVSENGTHLLTLAPSTTRITLGGLNPAKTYSFTVTATDTTGAASAASNTLSVTTPPQPAAHIVNPSITHTSNAITFQAKYTLPYTVKNVFIDTDANTSTGCAIATGTADIGADYRIENNTLYHYAGQTASSCKWSPVTSVTPVITDTDGLHTWTIPISALHLPGSSISAIFNGSDSSNSLGDYSTTTTLTLS